MTRSGDGVEHLEHAAACERLLRVRDLDPDRLAGDRAVDEHDATVGVAGERLAAGDHLLGVKLDERVRNALAGVRGHTVTRRRTSGLYLMRCGLVGVGTETLVALDLVVGEVALEPADLGVAFEREHVGGDAVEEPPIVADHHRAAREREQRVLERAHGVDVEVVGRLVEQQHVAALGEHLGEVDAVALTTGELADRLLLVASP